MSEQKKTVLILDERSDSLIDLFELVYAEGYETTGVSSGKEALACVARRKPDVLVDHLRGSETPEPPFLERLRNLSPRTRIIILSDTDSDSTGQGEEILEDTVEWIPGPFQASMLIDALDRGAQEVPAKAFGHANFPAFSERPIPALS